jgi:acyl-CoA reductase-like NAD-dependent aldehyde dehydrogenase
MEETIVPLIIDGEDFRHNSTFDVVSPSTAKTCWKAVSASTEDAIKAVETAQVAFPQWSSSSPTARAEILGKAADYLEANIETLAGYMMEEMGADRGTAQYFVLPLAINTCRSIAARCTTICGSVPVVAQARQSAMIWKEPYGVCLGIVPW